MSNGLTEALSNPGPHTVDSLAEKLPHFPAGVIQDALEALAAQGVLERIEGEGGRAEYRLVAPERYVQINRDVIVDPAARFKDRIR